jgi:hypothetical protein
MKKAGTWYGIGLILIILGFIDLAFLDYSGHETNGVMVTLWGLCAFIWGIRNELAHK